MADRGGQALADVLLVEDDPGDVLMTKEAFAHYQIRNTLHVVGDGEQAMLFLRQDGEYASVPKPGLILLDLNLPRRNGLEVLADLKSDDDLLSIPVVVLTWLAGPQGGSCEASPDGAPGACDGIASKSAASTRRH
jgi:CheY-like chemotaxis protein